MMRIRSVHSRRTEEIHRSAIAFIRGALRRGEHHVDADRGDHRIERGGELGISVADQVAEAVSCAFKIRGQVAGSWVTQAPVGWSVTPSRWIRRARCSITKAAYRRFKVTVST
jgi:hypothetical protein